MPINGEKYFFIGSLAKGIKILELLVEKGDLSVSEVAKHIGINRASSHRFLSTLLTLGYVAKNGNSRYQPTFKMLELGTKVANQFEIREVVRPFMQKLSLAYKETINLGVLDGTDILHIDKINSSEILRMDCPIGTRAPAYCTALGKSLLAYLSEDDTEKFLSKLKLKQYGPNTITSKKKLKEELKIIRTRGYAVDDEELVQGLRCVAAPIFDHNSRPRYSISVAGPAVRLTLDRIEHIKLGVRKVCKTISRHLGEPSVLPIKQK